MSGSLFTPCRLLCMLLGLSACWDAVQPADACHSLLSCLHPVGKKKKARCWECDFLPPVHTVTSAGLGITATILFQPCTKHKTQKVCAIMLGCFFFSIKMTPSVDFLHSEILSSNFNRTRTAQSIPVLPSVKNQNMAGTSEAFPQRHLTWLLEFVSLHPGCHPPHSRIIPSCLPFASHKRTRTAQRKRRSCSA